jgi:NitT/TauT family transport system permease protein
MAADTATDTTTERASNDHAGTEYAGTARTSTDQTITGLDALETAAHARTTPAYRRIWATTWPKLAALTLAVGAWQLAVASEWKPEYALPAPATVGAELWTQLHTTALWQGLATTGRRALVGFGAALAVGLLVGLAVARVRVLRAAVGSMITALQTMPSIAWFPLAILLFQLTEEAIFFVVVLGAAPAIANGVIAGVDYIPPLLLRAGRNIGARGLGLYRHVIAPAALPATVAGLKQGWAFAWRSLMAGELLVVIATKSSLGAQLNFARELSDAPWLLSTMIVILVLGLLVDAAFGAVDHAIRARWGLLDHARG